MTILILLVLVVLLWLAVLAPSAWRRYGERQGVGSIDHFHHQLQLLEHAGPKTVSPAYRLHTAQPGGGPDDAPAPSTDSSRPKLVLLRPTDDESVAESVEGRRPVEGKASSNACSGLGAGLSMSTEAASLRIGGVQTHDRV